MNKNLFHPLHSMPLLQSTEHPNWGRFAEDRSHAVFSIVDCLNRMGLREWVPRLVKWLGQYDGLEMYADDDDDPHVCVRDVIRKYLAQFKNNNSGTAAIIKDNIVKDILDQKFLFYRAHWGMSRIPDNKSRIWKPLEQSWFSFIQLGTASQDLHVWFSQRNPLPALEEHRCYLLRQAI